MNDMSGEVLVAVDGSRPWADVHKMYAAHVSPMALPTLSGLSAEGSPRKWGTEHSLHMGSP